MKKTYIFILIVLVLYADSMSIAIGQTYPASPLRVLSITGDTLTARFELPELQIKTPSPSGAGDAADLGTEIHFAGADRTLDVGRPQLPIYAQGIGIPVAGTPIVTVIQARPEVRSVENVRVTPDDPIFPTSVSTPRRASQGFYPSKLVEIIPSGFVRDQRIASLQINPVQYNSRTKQLRIFTSVTFRINFPYAPVAGGTSVGNTFSPARKPVQGASPVFESMFRDTLRNYEQAKLWRSQRRMSYSAVHGNGIPGAPALTGANTHRFKIPVVKTDLYRITYNNIKAAGVEPEDINLDTLQLESRGQKQGVYIFDENENDVLDPGEQIVFYGRALSDNKFTDENVYWLLFALRGEPAGNLEPSGVTTRDATPRTENLVSPTAFLTRERFEQNVHHDTLSGVDVKSELADHYFWVSFRGGNINTSRKDFPVELPMSVPRLEVNRDALLRIKFQGASRRGSALHLARISFNGLQLGRVEEWKRQASQIATRNIPQARIHHNQVNFMRIDALDANKTPAGSSDFYLDWYELDYWRNFQANTNRLEFNTNTEPRNRGKVQYRVSNVFQEMIDVYQLDDNGITSKLTGGEVSRRGCQLSNPL